jgi:hypothetical protein
MRCCLLNIVTCRPLARERVDKHVSTETDSWKPTCLCGINKYFLGYSTLYKRPFVRVVGGDEKRSLKSETVKYGHESQGTLTRERLGWRGPAAYIKDRPVLSLERAPHKIKTVIVKQ